MTQPETAAGVEYATTGSIAAARSLARHANVDLAVALRHLQNGTAAVLIEAPGGIAERKRNEQHVERIERLYDLKVRGILLGG